ncbi:MAG: UDP-2,3-diacylglucosamine diphosphatase LpxI [Acidobacteria bacterium]|nr:UDP-2,3-diacylglucosamine diphosphatase LpxI [Acidobacteriota bacterium]
MSTESSSEPLALIAGSTQMPCVVAEEARSRGRVVIAIAIQGITEPAIDDVADRVHWLEWGDINGFLGLLGKLRSEGIREAVMAGKVEQQRIYDDDAAEGLEGVLASMPVRHTDSLIQAVVNLISGAGIELLDSTDFLQQHIVREGTLTRRSPDDRESEDISHGWTVAKQLGALDIGQSVVIKHRAVVAIEAMEGTDECLRRAGALAGAGTVLVKVGKPDQDLRFDVPVVGASTIETMAEVGASALCVEADLTVLFDAEQFRSDADAAGIAVVARKKC